MHSKVPFMLQDSVNSVHDSACGFKHWITVLWFTDSKPIKLPCLPGCISLSDLSGTPVPMQ